MYFSFRHKWKTNKEAAKELMSTYPEHIVGMVLYEILKHHFEKKLFVRTKAAELVGRLACVLSVYCHGN